MDASPVFTVIIAAFNEADSIVDCVRAVSVACPEGIEILVVDGGSDATDSIVTGLEAEISGLRYIKNHNDRGKGHAIQRGIAEARSTIIVQFDADLQFMPDDIPKLAERVKSGACDVALGSRFTRESQQDAEAAVLRNFGNWLISLCASILFKKRMTDVLAGIKAWSRQAAEVIDLQTDGFGYEVEIPARALQRGLIVEEYPIGTRARSLGESKVTVFGSGSAIIKDMIGFWWNR